MASLVSDDKTVPPLPTGEEETTPTVDADEVITEDQMPCTVVITGLPFADQETTNKSLSDTFHFTTIQKTIYQVDGDKQHAVVVLGTSEAATSACEMSGCTILGGTVNIIRAQQLQGEEGNAKQESGTDRSTNKMFLQAKSATVGVTASAIVLGSQAVDSIKSLDKRTGISKTVNAAVTTTSKKVTELDEQFGVSTAVKKTAASVTEGVKGIDEKYDISGRTTRAASDASKAASNLASKALENPTVSKGWGFMKGLGKSVVSAAAGFAREADDTIKQANQQAKERRGVTTTTTTATPPTTTNDGEGETKETSDPTNTV